VQDGLHIKDFDVIASLLWLYVARKISPKNKTNFFDWSEIF
jgi:hypothetical protein